MNLSFEIDQEAGSVKAGGILSGILHVKASKAIPASELHIFVRGKEYKSKTSGLRPRATEKSQFVCLDSGIPFEMNIVCNGKIQAGSYQIPFRFELPAWIPSSTSIIRSEEEVRIDYCLRAVVLGSGALDNYQARHPVCIVSSKPVPTVPHVSNFERHVITKLSTQHCGEITTQIKILDAALAPGQTPRVQVFFTNNSTTVVKSIAMELQQKVGSATKKYCKAVFKLDASRTPRLDTNTVQQQMSDPTRIEHNEKQLSAARKTATDSFQMPTVPELVLDSSDGLVEHELKITLQTESLYNSVVCRVPVSVSRGSDSQEENSSETLTEDTVAIGMPVAHMVPLPDWECDHVPAATYQPMALASWQQ